MIANVGLYCFLSEIRVSKYYTNNEADAKATDSKSLGFVKINIIAPCAYSFLWAIDKAARTQAVTRMYLNAGNVTKRFFPVNSGLNNGKLPLEKNSEQIAPVRTINMNMSEFL